MAYAAYREHPGFIRTQNTTVFHVLDVAVSSNDARIVRRLVADCADAGIVRCEPLLHERHSSETDAQRVRIMIRLPLSRYAEVLHALIASIPSGEIGRLVTWRDHLARCGLRHGNDPARASSDRPCEPTRLGRLHGERHPTDCALAATEGHTA